MRRTAVAALALLAVSCGGSTLEGPQFTALPQGLAYNGNPGQTSGKLADMELVRVRSWMNVSPPPFVSASIAEYKGGLAALDVEPVRRQLLGITEGSSQEASLPPIETLTIDGRLSSGWPNVSQSSHGYTAIVPYSDVTYVVAFDSGIPDYQTDDAARNVALSFHRNPDKAPNVIVPVVAIFLVLAAVWTWMRRRRSVDPRDRSDGTAREF